MANTRTTAPVFPPIALVVALAVALAACKPEAAAPVAAQPDAPAAQAVPEAPPVLKDEIEQNERYVVGISYPPTINRHPGLARAIAAYVAEERAGLMQAVEAIGNDKPRAPYELSLGFEQVAATPQWIVIAADGSRYTGGVHGEPLVARFVWLPDQEKLLTADELIPSAEGWLAVSGYVREQLHTQVSVRADADEMSPEDRAEFVRDTNRMIDAGTEPDADSFRQFQPVLGADGKATALRFVFPPYQVGPYSDGTQSVDVPLEVLRSYLAPEYAGLFGQ
ncbi:MAG: DUF3298 domain-containing protein [Pseudoxanthomonas sp.]